VKNVANDANGNPQFATPNGYAPDSLNNYEVGIKTSLFNRHLQINLSAYDMDWSNVQFQFYNPTELGNTSFSVNGPDYNIKGVELQLNALLMPGLTAQGSATYNHSKQTSSPCLVSNIPASPTFGQCITEVRATGATTATPFQNPYGALGTTAPFSPKVQASGRIRYDWKIDELKAFVQVGANYTG
jgi:outer membrane receptor protein involved in Fe transport